MRRVGRYKSIAFDIPIEFLCRVRYAFELWSLQQTCPTVYSTIYYDNIIETWHRRRVIDCQLVGFLPRTARLAVPRARPSSYWNERFFFSFHIARPCYIYNMDTFLQEIHLQCVDNVLAESVTTSPQRYV